METKEYLYAAGLMVVATFASCTDDLGTVFSGDEISVSAEMGKGGRTELGEDSRTITWSTGDKIYMFDSDGSSYGTLSLKEGVNSADATFNGTIVGRLSEIDKALYPVPVKDDNGYTFDFQANRTWSANSAAPMIGDFDYANKHVQFSNLAALVRIDLAGYNYNDKSELVLTMTGGPFISGKALVDVADETLAIAGGGNTVTVTGFGSARFVDIPVPAGTYTNYSVTIDGVLLAEGAAETLGRNSVAILGQKEVVMTPNGEGIYEIRTAAEMFWLAEQVNAGNAFNGQTFKLMNDIDMSLKDWTPIGIVPPGESTNNFGGTFDGGGFTLSGLKAEGGDAALFGRTSGATIKNLTIDNSEFVGSNWAGCLVAYVSSTLTLENVRATNSVVTEKGERFENRLLGSGRKNANVEITIDDAAVVDNASDLAEILTADEEDIKVVLANSIDLPISSLGTITGGSGEYKLGGENTESITIDLNNNRLNITTAYWSAIGAKNDEATITIKNGAMTSTGNSAGTWNAWDVRFSNCNYVIENVEFEKAVALDNAGKTTLMKGVTIKDNHDTDTYALWITAEGQTVTLDDNCVIDMLECTDGRGIKIDDQYVDSPVKVTLNVSNTTFFTEEKAAILVKSPYGADVTLSNVNIENVAADKDCEVWVDKDASDTYDLVNVIGGSKRLEGAEYYEDADGNAVVMNANALSEAVASGATDLYLMPGEYIIPDEAKGKTLAIKGTGKPEDVKVAVTKVGTSGKNCDFGLDGSTVTFEDLTITTNSSTHIGYARCNGTYKNCIINGTYTLYGRSVFEGCTFNVSGDVYNIWTWGAMEIEFVECTFNSDGKALLLYQEGTNTVNLTVKKCIFNDKGGLTAKKAAIEIGDAPYGETPTYNVIVSEPTVNGYEINNEGISTGTTLWGNKNSMPKERLNVTIDDIDVY